jgi:ribulose-phosphate 3-epimerase
VSGSAPPAPVRIAPSILSADFARLADEIARVEAGGGDWIHVDVMDGHFVSNITIGPPVVKALSKVAKIPLDVHIMISEPDRYAREFCEAGAATLTFHVEASPDPVKTCETIRALGVRPGIAVKPGTWISPAIERAIAAADLVLVMTVEPGFGGQRFMNDMIPKIERARALAGPHRDVEVDGGVDPETVRLCAAAGANAIVAGSFVFKGKDVAHPIARLRAAAEEARRR